MIELLIGRYRTGKTGRLVKKVIEYKREHPLEGCLILVPSHRYGRLLREQLLGHLDKSCQPGGTAGLFGVQIATVYESCDNVLKQAGELTKILPRQLCVNAVAQALQRLVERGELNQLASIAKFAGAASAIFRLIDELERAAMSPWHVVAAVNNTAGETSRHLELAKIYREYWAILEENGCSDQKRQAFAAREVLSRKQMPSFGYRMLAIDGFDRISPLQAEVMLALSKQAQDTHLSFDYLRPEDRNGTEEMENEYSWKDASYRELSSRFNVEPYTVPSCLRESELKCTAFKTLDIFLESQEIARRCKQAINDRKIAPCEILVVARDIAPYSGPLRSAFADAALAFYLDETIEYKSLPLLKFLRQAFSLSLNDFPRRQVLDCLRSPFCSSAAFKFKHSQIDRLDKATIKAGLVGGRERWDEYLKTIKDEDFSLMLDAFLWCLTPPGKASIAQYASWMEDRECQLRHKQDQATISDEEHQSLQGFRLALRTLVLQTEIFGDSEVTYAQFFKKFETVLEEATFSTQNPGPNAIHICAAEHAPNRRFDEVYVAGTTEGQFPKHSGESGFASAEERLRWKAYGVDITNPRQEPGFERALFTSLSDRARFSICFSYPECDLGGDEVVPSFFFTDGTIKEEAERVDVSKQALLRPYSAKEAIGGWLWHRPGVELPDQWTEQERLTPRWQQISLSLIGAYQRHESNAPTAYNGYLVDLTDAHVLDVTLPPIWSATSLGTYGQCPFRFWIKYPLGIKPQEEPELGLNVFVKGRLYHKILEVFYVNRQAAGEITDTAAQEELLQKSFREALQEMEKDPEFHPGPYWQNEQNDVLFRVRRFVEYDDQRLAREKTAWTPSLFEIGFGKSDSQFGPLAVPTDQGKALVCGSVDRIDLSSTTNGSKQTATVIDYKTGSSPITEEDARAGANVQLGLYAMAVESVIKPDVSVVAGNYLSVNAAKSVGRINFEKSSDLIEVTRDFIQRTVSNVKRGDFSVRPYNAKACKNCDYHSVCRITDLKRFSTEEDC